jgi:hypothetical protein
MYLRGQDHMFSAPAVAPVIAEFFSTLPQASAIRQSSLTGGLD